MRKQLIRNRIRPGNMLNIRIKFLLIAFWVYLPYINTDYAGKY